MCIMLGQLNTFIIVILIDGSHHRVSQVYTHCLRQAAIASPVPKAKSKAAAKGKAKVKAKGKGKSKAAKKTGVVPNQGHPEPEPAVPKEEQPDGDDDHIEIELRDRIKARKFRAIFDTLPKSIQTTYTEAPPPSYVSSICSVHQLTRCTTCNRSSYICL